MGNGQTVEINQRLLVVSISLALGMIFIAVMSSQFEHLDSRVGAFLLDRHTENFPYPFTVQNVMWLMFSVGCGELWVRFGQSNLELEQASRKYLPEDDETVLRAQDLGSLYKRVLPADGKPVFFLQRLIKRCILQCNKVVRFVPFCDEGFDWQSIENDDT